MAKEKPDEKPNPKPDPKPDEKPSEVKTPVNPTTGESEDKEWRANVNRKLDGLAAATKALGEAVQAWGFPGPEKDKPAASKPDDTSAPAEKTESLDDWSH